MTTGGDSTSGVAMEAGSVKRGLPPRWVASVIAGLALGLPFAWLLAVLAFLPFYLGLFFFTLIGLLIGAVQFRVGKPAVPWPKVPAYWAGIIVVVAMMAMSMVGEYYNTYTAAIRHVKESFKIRSAEQIAEIEAATPGRVREYFASAYPPGGPIGYVRWAATSGEMPIGQYDDGRPIQYTLPQGPIGWSIRVVLSTALLAFGICSQVAGLAKRPVAADEAEGGESEAMGGDAGSVDV